MGAISFKRSSLENYNKYNSLLAGNAAFEPFTSDFELLETTTLASSASSVTFSSLNSSYGSDYKHLQIRAVAKTDRTTDSGDSMTININSASTLKGHSLFGNGSSVISFDPSFADAGRLASSESGISGDTYGASVIDILDAFETGKNKTIRALSGSDRVYLSSGLMVDTAATDTILLDQASGSNFIAGSRFSLYGIRG